MRVALMITVLLLFAVQAAGQQLQITLSPRQIEKLESIADPARKLKKYKRTYRRESIRQNRDYERMMNRKYDSLSESLTARAEKLRSLQDSITGSPEIDSMRQWVNGISSRVPKGLPKEDELTSVLEKSGLEKLSMAGTEKISDMMPDVPLDQQIPTLPQGLNIPEIPNLPDADQLTGDLSIPTLTEKLSIPEIPDLPDADQFMGDLRQFQNLPSGYAAPIQQLGGIPDPRQLADSAYVKEQLKKQLEKKFMEFLESNPGVINSIRTKAALLMKKYSVVPNSNDLSTAVKRNSLEGKPLGQRIVLGLNFQFLSLDPISFDFSPQLGYRINTQWAVGLSGSYRFSSSSIDSLHTSISNTIGVRAFSRYEVIHSLSGYVEVGEYTQRVISQEVSGPSTWEPSFILGLCKRLPVHRRVDMMLLMGYNFLHRDSRLNPNPFVVRVGIESNQFAFMKRK